MSAPWSSEPDPARKQRSIDVVLDFFASWETETLADFGRRYCSFLTEDCEQVNSGLPPMSRAAKLALFTDPTTDIGFVGIRVRDLKIAARGRTVFTERVDDHYDSTGAVIWTVPLAGVLEVTDDGLISRYYDYFDPGPWYAYLRRRGDLAARYGVADQA